MAALKRRKCTEEPHLSRLKIAKMDSLERLDGKTAQSKLTHSSWPNLIKDYINEI